MFDYFIMTKHFLEQYQDRLNVGLSDVKKRVKYDLSIKMVRRIVDIGDKRYVYTRNNREFVFKYDKSSKVWIAKTVIRHSKSTIEKVVNKRVLEKELFNKS